MVRRGSPVRVRHWALLLCRDFLLRHSAPPTPEVHQGYVRPPAGPSRPSAGAPAAQSPEAARRADPERSERVDGGAGRRHQGIAQLHGRLVGMDDHDAAKTDTEGANAAKQHPVLLTVRDVAEIAGLSDRAIYQAVSR